MRRQEAGTEKDPRKEEETKTNFRKKKFTKNFAKKKEKKEITTTIKKNWESNDDVS